MVKSIGWLTAFFCLTSMLSAYSVHYSGTTFAQSGSGTRQTMTVVNDENVPIAIEINMVEVHHTKDGTEVRKPANDDFLIYPNKLLVPPQNQAKVNMIWKGKQRFRAEKMYRAIVEEIQLGVKEKVVEQESEKLAKAGKSGGKVIVYQNYEKALFVGVPKAKPQLKLLNTRHARLESDKTVQDDLLIISVVNEGNKHFDLDQIILHVTSEETGKTESFTPQPNGSTRILPYEERDLVMKWPASLPLSSVKVGFSIDG